MSNEISLAAAHLPYPNHMINSGLLSRDSSVFNIENIQKISSSNATSTTEHQHAVLKQIADK